MVQCPGLRRACLAALAATLALIATGCASTRFHEYYYTGIYDPESQLPQEVYRYRITGYASAVSSMKFASGWLPKELVDPLGELPTAPGAPLGDAPKTPADGKCPKNVPEVVCKATKPSATFESLRPLYLFGPEGFRPAPQDHRLCVVLSHDPEQFFRLANQFAGGPQDKPASATGTALKLAKEQRDATKRLLELTRRISEEAK